MQTGLVFAGPIFYVSGNNPETGHDVTATIEFEVSGMDLLVTLTNTSDPLATNGDVLTGVTFVPSITPLSYTAANVLAGGTYWSDKTTQLNGPADWTTGWTDTPGVIMLPAGTVGAAATGFGGYFMNPSGAGADYGVVSNGTYPQGGGGPGNPNKFPLADNSIQLTFHSDVSLDGLTISDVNGLFGTSGEAFVIGQLPEPSTCLLGLCGLVICCRRSRSRN